jgi:hypothetical protein
MLSDLKAFGSFPRGLNNSSAQEATDERQKESVLAKRIAKAFAKLDLASKAYVEALKKRSGAALHQITSDTNAQPAASSSSDRVAKGTKRESAAPVSALDERNEDAAVDTNMEKLFTKALRSASDSQKQLLQEIKASGSYPRGLNASTAEAASDDRRAEAELAKKVSYQLPKLDSASKAYFEALEKNPRAALQQMTPDGSARPAGSSSDVLVPRGTKRKSGASVSEPNVRQVHAAD